ncbi:MAG: tandem-95 repeat protein [Ardenticatenaceae bacterium]|nr:tandem-95 repeat protein [Ardenticatenaceae bacterium]
MKTRRFPLIAWAVFVPVLLVVLLVTTLSPPNAQAAPGITQVTARSYAITNNEPPIANDDSYTTTEDISLTVAAPGVLANDSDLDNDTLTPTLQTQPGNGSVVLNTDGSFVYTPTANFNGSDSFVYAIVDGDFLPAAYWAFNEGSGSSTADLSGNELTASLAGDTSFTTTLPTVPTFSNSYALSFDGSDDWVAVPDSNNINLGTFSQRTVMVWFRVDDVNLNSRRQIIWEEGGTGNGLNIYLYDGALYGGAWSSNSAWDGTWISSTNVISGQWHHAALVLDSTSTSGPEANALQFYLDGQLVESGEGAQLGNHTGDIGIGDIINDTKFADGSTVNGGGGHGFAGLIDEVQVYNVPLTQTDIQMLMDTNRPSMSSTATVILTVTAMNDAPVAVPDDYRTLNSQPLTVTVPGVLANDSDVDGDVISATLISDVSSGTLNLALDGSFIYTPAVSSGVDSFTYAVTDGLLQSDPTTVALTMVNSAPFGTCANFEEGTLPDYFLTETTSSSGANGRVQVSTDYPYSGNYALTIDTDCDGCGGNTTQAAIMVMDLTGVTEADLIFRVQEFSDENDAADGVFISDDGGVTWAQIVNLNDYPSNYTLVSLDLDEEVTAAGMSLVDDFLIKFQSEDNFSISSDGYAFDDICVRAPQPEIDVSPVSLDIIQYRDEVVTRTLQIDNSGTLPLTWSLTEAENDCSVPSDLSWLTTLTTTGVISPVNSLDVDVVMGETDLTAGSYSGLLCLNSNDPDTPTLPVTVTLEARPFPGQLTSDLTSLDVEVALGYSATFPLELTNIGETAVTFRLVEMTDGALTSNSSVTTNATAAPLNSSIPPAVMPSQAEPTTGEDSEGGATADIAPGFALATAEKTNAPLAIQATGDSLFQLDAETSTGHVLLLGVEYALGSYWVTSGGAASTSDPNYLFELDQDGTVLHSWEQGTTSEWGWRDLAFDGDYLYSSDSAVVTQIDPNSGQATGTTIPCPTDPCRALAYDPATDHFWTANFDSDIWEFDRSGTIINQYTNTLNIYGAAWDTYSDGGPYLWVWSQDGSPAVTATQIDPATGLATGVSFIGDNIGGDDIAGGADIVDNHPDYPGQLLFVGMHQATSDTIVGYDLGTSGMDVDWVSEDPMTGTVPVPGPQTVNITFDAAAPSITQMGVYTANLLVFYDGDASPLTIPLTMTVINDTPVADAGDNQSVNINQLVTLDGSGSFDLGGHLPLTYQWVQTDGPAVVLSEATAVAPTFTAPATATSLTFSLVVTDSMGLPSATSEVTVLVKPYEIFLPVIFN